MIIEHFFHSFQGFGADGLPGVFDGKAFICWPGPDYRDRRWILRRAEGFRRGDRVEMCELCEAQLENELRHDPRACKEIERKLGPDKGVSHE